MKRCRECPASRRSDKAGPPRDRYIRHKNCVFQVRLEKYQGQCRLSGSYGSMHRPARHKRKPPGLAITDSAQRMELARAQSRPLATIPAVHYSVTVDSLALERVAAQQEPSAVP